MCTTDKQQSSTKNWKSPEMTSDVQLRLYNSFTKKKELFTPINGNEVRWYSCGPTVYETSHMGHARSYISFDILRRVMEHYFGYDILYCMNITDIDDKIIKRARERYFFSKYKDNKSLTIEKLFEDCQLALQHVKDVRARETDRDKIVMYDNQITAAERLFQNMNSLSDIETNRNKLFDGCRDILPSYLDFIYDYAINSLDNELFLELARYYESEFHTDMSRLNILPPHVVTRVSEYIPEIIKFIEKIMENGYAYESNSSIYFDTIKFHQQHSHVKLEPERMNDIAALSEGEGSLTATSNSNKDKRNQCDFVLWKKSKLGEPSWHSPWGYGRPGWHIECSVMASTVLGPQFDIHTGGIDLKFPHHDNEISQSAAHYNSDDNWVNYFLHSGHLTISGCKMSRSLKNFVTIKEALEKYTSKQIRLLFLLHSWSSTLDYSDHGMETALNYEKYLNEFFLNIKAHSRSLKQLNHSDAFAKFNDHDLLINERFSKIKQQIHFALCDSIDTPTVMKHIRDLMSVTNTYMNTKNTIINCLLLRNIAIYITDLLDIFGLNSSLSSTHDNDIGFTRLNEQQIGTVNIEDIAIPYMEAFASFRDDVRNQAIAIRNKDILTLCDRVRDETFPKLGFRLEDQGIIGVTNKPIIKYCGLEVSRQEHEQSSTIQNSHQKDDKQSSV